jgi:hypothetical protein
VYGSCTQPPNLFWCGHEANKQIGKLCDPDVLPSTQLGFAHTHQTQVGVPRAAFAREPPPPPSHALACDVSQCLCLWLGQLGLPQHCTPSTPRALPLSISCVITWVLLACAWKNPRLAREREEMVGHTNSTRPYRVNSHSAALKPSQKRCPCVWCCGWLWLCV